MNNSFIIRLFGDVFQVAARQTANASGWPARVRHPDERVATFGEAPGCDKVFT
jgi:hypothetical protein